MQEVEIASGGLSARIAAAGAEPRGLRRSTGLEALWQAGPIWPRHAPILFPIVGRLKGDQLRHDGKVYRMTQHGFARDRVFAWTAVEPTRCALELRDDAETRALYPFAFRLSVVYEIIDDALRVDFGIANPGDGTLPASIGFHPAFNWPLRRGFDKDGCSIVFAHDETRPILRLDDGLLQNERVANPVRDRRLALSESLFAQDALIFDPIESASVRYESAEGPAVAVSWTGMRQLGLWSRAGGDFVCVEPWRGFASPEDFDGEFADKPGLVLIPPGESRSFSVTIRIDGA